MPNRYTLTIVLRPGRWSLVGLRQWLKAGLRRFGIRCVRIEAVGEAVVEKKS